MGKIIRDFISDERRDFRIKFGHLLASSLSGFICGALVATVIWMIAFRYLVENL